MTAPVAVEPAPPDLATGLEDIAARLRGQGAEEGAALVLVAADLVVHPEALADLADDPRPGSAVLTSASGVPDLRVRAGQVVSVATGVHRATAAGHRFVGALRIAAEDRDLAASVARDLAALARRHRWQPSGDPGADPLALVLLGLVRSGVPVRSITVDPWPWARGGVPERAAVRMKLDGLTPQGVHLARLARATKAEDGLVATFLSRPVSRRLTPVALRLGMSPNAVTAVSVALGLLAAAAFAVGAWPWLVVGAVLLQLSLVVDCVDGDVARYRRAFTPTGAWLDASTDRLKEFACYGGLAWGAGTGRTAWVLAAVMLTLQTARHAMDYTFTAVRELRESAPVRLPLDDPDDSGRVDLDDQSGSRALVLSRRSARLGGVVWAKKALHLGIGERWLVLSLFAAANRPQLGLVVLLALATVSGCYVTVGRLLRTRAWRPGGAPAREREIVMAREREIVMAQVDAGPLLPPSWARRLAGPADGSARFAWLRPAVLRVLEYAGVLALTATLPGVGAGAGVFALLLVVAAHHYDALYRVLQGLRAGPTGSVGTLGLGWPGRLLLVAVIALVGAAHPGAGRTGIWLLAAALGVLFLVVEPAGALRAIRDQPAAELPAEGATGG
jgi:hypothetical protein